MSITYIISDINLISINSEALLSFYLQVMSISKHAEIKFTSSSFIDRKASNAGSFLEIAIKIK